jgi:hypothetical protein
MWNLYKNKVLILEFRLGHPFTSTNSLTINPLASTGYFTELLHLHHLIWNSFAIKSYSLQGHQTCDFDIPIKTSLIFPLKVPFTGGCPILFPYVPMIFPLFLGDFSAKKTASPSFRQVQEHDQQPQCGRKKIMARHRAGPWRKTQKRTSNASE